MDESKVIEARLEQSKEIDLLYGRNALQGINQSGVGEEIKKCIEMLTEKKKQKDVTENEIRSMQMDDKNNAPLGTRRKYPKLVIPGEKEWGKIEIVNGKPEMNPTEAYKELLRTNFGNRK